MTRKSSNPEFTIDPKKWGWKIISYWWLFVIALGISLPAGQAYLRYSTPKYVSEAKLLIKGTDSGSGLSEAAILSEGLGLNTGGKDLFNETAILKSRPLLTEVIERLNANITCSRIGRFRNTELYKDSPIVLKDYQFAEGVSQLSFYIEMGYDKNFQFSLDKGGDAKTYKFGERFKNEFGSFLIEQSTSAKLIPGTYLMSVMPVVNVANSYKNRLEVEVLGGKFSSSSILQIKLIDPTPAKALDIINTLIDVYNEDEVSDKTEVLRNTVNFVSSRISVLTTELDSIESDIESFKSKNSIITENAASSLDFSLGELRISLGKLSELELQKELLLALEDNLTKNPESLIPTNVSRDAPELAGLILEYNELYLRRKKLDETASDINPLLQQYTVELNDLRSLITQSLRNLQGNLEIPLMKAKAEIDELQKDLIKVPSVEKRLLEKLRMQSVKENLYLFLLQKKEETELSMAISTANTRVIESASSGGFAIFPNKKFTRLGSILLGIFIPIFIIILIELLVSTINSEEALKSITTVPIIGRIAHYDKKQNPRLDPGERSIRAEMFKLLRTNLNFTNMKKEKQVFVITSSMSGEGKSITAINLAITIGLGGKKAVVVDMDLRKPKIGQYMGDVSPFGTTNYLMGEKSLEDILVTDKEHQNFYYITSGPIPPNPAELIISDRVGTLIEELKKQFDYIIIDCPPIGVVSDGLLLRDYLTNMLYVVRHQKSKKEAIQYMEEQFLNGELVKPSIIINDIKVGRKNKAYGGYTSGYGGGYYSKSK